MRNQALAYLILFAIVDIFIPVPIVALILLFVIFQKPPWFRELVDDVYRVR